MAKAPNRIPANSNESPMDQLLELELAAAQVRREIRPLFEKQCTDPESAQKNEEWLQLLYARLTPIQDQIIKTPAQDIQGIMVKLRLFAWCRQEYFDEIPADATTDERAMASLLIDMRNLKMA